MYDKLKQQSNNYSENGGIVYNVTTQVERQIAKDWLHWIREEHIPDIIATGCFIHATVLQLIEVDEEQGPTFAIQYHADSKAFYNRYIEIFAEEMRKRETEKWGNHVIAFRSVLQVVN